MLGWVGALAVAFTAATSPTPDVPHQPDADVVLTSPAPEHAVLIYEYAAETAPCTLDWTVLGGVAGVASNHGLLDPAVEPEPIVISAEGNSQPAILGLPLDGADGRAAVDDTDDGALDESDILDHAVGPFQFIPATWELYATDGNGDSVADPQNFWDAAASAAALLCDKGVENDVPTALTRYFGTDQWNDWALRRAEELRVFRRQRAALRADLPAPVLDRVQLLPQDPAPAGASASLAADTLDADPVETDPLDTDPATTGSLDTDPAATGPDSTATVAPEWFAPLRELIAGDWNGDGAFSSGAFEVTRTGGRFVFADREGRPYGQPIIVDDLLPDGVLEQFVLDPVVGDWDRDGRDTPGLAVLANGVAEVILFDRRGEVVERTQLGPADPVAVSFEVVSGPPPRAGPEPVFWKVETAHDGTSIRLFRVNEIAVAEEIAQDVAELVAAAEADGITLEAWGWRSHQQQLDLRRQNCADVWATPAAACSPPTAVPGTSRHEFGLALDFHTGGQTIDTASPVFLWLTENAGTYGLENLPSEPWHWSVDGG